MLHCRSQKAWLCLAAILLLFPARLLAWGDLGHEIAGVIAYARLTPAAKGQVDALLASDRDTLTRPDFVSRTTWADEYRDSDRQTTKRRYEQTRNWHFVNIDVDTGRIFGCDRKLPPGTPASAGPAKACIIDKIDQFAAELRDPTTPRRETLIALKFLLHLVGDLHHPLHTADNRDRGGNDVVVVFGRPLRRESLHSYWDNYLVQRLGGDAHVIGSNLGHGIASAQAQSWSKGDSAAWAKESYQVAKKNTYEFGDGRGGKPGHGDTAIRLDNAYEQRAVPIVREQLAKAGVRLATVINTAFR